MELGQHSQFSCQLDIEASIQSIEMSPLASTTLFLNEVEHFAQRKFLFRDEMGLLIELSESRGMKKLFDEIIFFAKFITNAQQILKRIGSDSDEVLKLRTELTENLEKTSTLLRTLIKESSDEVKGSFMHRFLAFNQESLNNLFSLLRELSWIKNYSLDKDRQR